MASAAAALDAADGVMDGRHFGRPIVQAGGPQFVQAQPAVFGGFPQQFGGAQFVGAQTFGYPQQFGGFAQPAFGGASSAALALDAADGVIDGKSFGRPIVQAQPTVFGGFPQQFGTQFGGFPQQFGTQFVGAQTVGYPQAFGTQFGGFAQPAFGGASSAALALDAADGVIDGKSFGRPIVQAQPTVFGGFPQQFGTQFGGFPQQFVGAQTVAYPQQFGGFAQPTFVGGASSAALALDAADGVIDGKSFGRPIVQAGGLVPYTGVAAAPQFAYGGVPTFAAAPQVFQGGAVPSQFYGQRFAGYGGVPAYPGYGASYGAPAGRFVHGGSAAQRAAQLDAADGVMDGRHFGRPIVQQRRR